MALVRDSAGIEIVTNAGPGAWGKGEAWNVEEAATIGELDGPAEYTFNRIAGLVASPAGRVYILASGDNVVKAYTTGGDYLFTFGGPGKGPAEFERAYNLSRRGDTILVYDFSLSKLAHFTADGELLRTERSNLTLFQHGFPAQIAPVPGGYSIVLSTGCSLPPPEERRPQWKLLTLDRGAIISDTLALYTARSLLPLYGSGDSFCTTTRAPAARNHSLAVRPDGLAAYGEGESYEIRTLPLRVTATEPRADASSAPATGFATAEKADALRHPLRIIRRDIQPLPFTPAEAATYRAERIREYESRDSRRDMIAALEAAWDTTAFPRTWPAFDALHWDDRDHLWARRGGPDTTPTRAWDIFDPEGIFLGTVALPAGLTVHAITGDHVWGTLRDEFDVQYVKGFRIVSGASHGDG
jgi:hypothetical protein